MTPCEGYFIASFALGEKAVRAAHETDLPVSALEVIDIAKKYAEGRGVRLEVRSAEMFVMWKSLLLSRWRTNSLFNSYELVSSAYSNCHLKFFDRGALIL